jgi:hypothetical protein
MPIRRAPIHKMTKGTVRGRQRASGKVPVAARTLLGEVGRTSLGGPSTRVGVLLSN